jgi:uncharacterized protein (TIGR03437 family)
MKTKLAAKSKAPWIRLCALLILGASAVQPQTLSIVSAASFDPRGSLAPDMIVTAFSSAIVPPFTGYSVDVGNSPASVFSVAEGQISFLMPPGVPSGEAAISVRTQGGVVAAGTARIASVAPGIFTANSSGTGAPAGHLLQINADGSRSTFDLFQEATGGGAYLPRPIFSIPGDLYITLYGTGIRGRSGSVTATLAGRPVPVLAAVAQGTFEGLDQINLGPLPAVTDRRGEVDLEITVDGVTANRVAIATNGPALGQWGTRGQLIEANSEFAVGELAGKIYVLGGYPSTRQTKATVQVYDPVQDRWELTTPMPIPLNHNMAASVGGKLYMIGGQLTDAGSGNFSDRVFEYDPNTRQWTERTRMPTARGGGVALVVDDKIYVAGGRPPRGADFAVYEPATDTWRTLPDMPTQRNHLSGAAVNGKVYIIGGRFEGGSGSLQSAAVEVYDPATNTWSARAPMPKPRGGLNAVAANGCIHTFGGEGNPQGLLGMHADHDVYNPVTNSWTSLAPMPTAIHGVTGLAFLNGLIYLPGGGTALGGNSGSLIHQVYRPAMVCR